MVSFHVYCDPLRTRSSESFDIAIGMQEHQVCIEKEFSPWTEIAEYLGAETDIGDEMPVHNIQVNPA
jgi:hypothetical protein